MLRKWYNECQKIDHKSKCYHYFSKKNLNHISHLFENNGKMRNWEDLRAKFDLDENKKFDWRQIIYTIPCAGKEMFLKCGNNIINIT